MAAQIPGRYAPWLGAAVGAAFGLRGAAADMKSGLPSSAALNVATGAGIGFLSGCILWWLDWRKRRRS